MWTSLRPAKTLCDAGSDRADALAAAETQATVTANSMLLDALLAELISSGITSRDRLAALVSAQAGKKGAFDKQIAEALAKGLSAAPTKARSTEIHGARTNGDMGR